MGSKNADCEALWGIVPGKKYRSVIPREAQATVRVLGSIRLAVWLGETLSMRTQEVQALRVPCWAATNRPRVSRMQRFLSRVGPTTSPCPRAGTAVGVRRRWQRQ